MKFPSIFAQVLIATLLFGSASALAGGSTSCIQNERDLNKAPKINQIVDKMGGIGQLEGTWKLGGFAGAIKNVRVTFKSAASGMQALVDGLDTTPAKWGDIAVCGTTQTDTLRVQVLNKNQALYLHAVNESTLQLAQVTNGKVGQYYSFAKQ